MVTTDDTHKRYKILSAITDKSITELLQEAITLLEEKYRRESNERAANN